MYGSPGRPLAFTWKRKADDRRATLPLRARARITELVALGEETSQVTASVRVEVTQGIARQIVLALPDGLVVNQVQGANVGDWNQAQASLTVAFLEPVASEASLVVTAEMRIPREGAVTIPIVRLPAAERETGGLAVDVIGPGEMADRQPRGLDPADASDLGDIVQGRESPSMAAFRFKPIAGSAPRALTLTVTRFTPQAVLVANVEEARYDALVAEDGKTLVHARYAVRNNQRSFLAVTLPPRVHAVERHARRPSDPPRPVRGRGGAAAASEGTDRRRGPGIRRRARLPPARRAVDREGQRATRSPGRRSAGLPHGAVAASFAAIQGRATPGALSRRSRSRAVVPRAGESRRSFARRREAAGGRSRSRKASRTCSTSIVRKPAGRPPV